MTSPLSPLHRAWRRLPAGPRRAALRGATALLAPRPDRPPPPLGAGMALLGEFARPSGLGMGVRLIRAALDAMGMATVAIDIDAGRAPLPPAGMPLILHVNAPMLPLALLRQRRALLRGRRVIGLWNWELPEMPADWRIGLRHVHEVWVTSRFTAGAMARLDGSIPLRVVSYPLAIAPPVPAAIDRAGFGLPPGALVVLVSFNLASSFVRKNPLAAIDAFRTAFADRPDRLLLLKVGHPGHFPEDFAALRRHIGDAANIRLETRAMSVPETHALTACADIVLSLHRSEGFGLVPAEAMLLGRPVIATGWSGNMDFMDADSAALVPFRLVPAHDPRGVLDVPGAVWAEPDIAAAAAVLRALADDPAARAALAARGRAHATAALSDASLRAALAGLAP
jgi:glycosyltransferase involved in cell wall biosynthesis